MAGLFHTAMLLCLLGSLAGLLDFLGWPWELPAHFRVQCCAFLLAGCVVYALLRAWKKVAVFAAAAGVLGAALYDSLPTAARAPGTGERLAVCSFNVLTSNRETEPVLRFLRTNHFDAVFLMEVDDRWLAALEHVRDIYPFIVSEPRGDNFGVALLSRTQPESAEIIEHGDHDLPTIVARVGGFGLVGTHTAPPVSLFAVAYRNDQMIRLAHGPAGRTNTLVVGDFNCTPWVSAYKDFVRESGLLNARHTFDRDATWPVFAPRWLRIPIDHALVSPDLIVTDFRTGPDLGSDHLPLIVEIARRAPR